MSLNKALVWGTALIGLIFCVGAIYYWITPAGALPQFMPGYEAGAEVAHFKHGLASIIVGSVFLIVAWFASGLRRA